MKLTEKSIPSELVGEIGMESNIRATLLHFGNPEDVLGFILMVKWDVI